MFFFSCLLACMFASFFVFLFAFLFFYLLTFPFHLLLLLALRFDLFACYCS